MNCINTFVSLLLLLPLLLSSSTSTSTTETTTTRTTLASETAFQKATTTSSSSTTTTPRHHHDTNSIARHENDTTTKHHHDFELYQHDASSNTTIIIITPDTNVSDDDDNAVSMANTRRRKRRWRRMTTTTISRFIRNNMPLPQPPSQGHRQLWMKNEKAVEVMLALPTTTKTSTTTKQPNEYDKIDPRIVNGVIVNDRDRYPFYGYPVGTENCGMTVVWYDIGMTAAHCTGAFLQSGVEIGGNTIDGSTSHRYQVLYEVIHPLYNASLLRSYADILLFKINGTLPESSLVTLNTDPNIPTDHDNVTIIGYGSESSYDTSASYELRSVTLPIASYDTCQQYWGNINDTTTICVATVNGMDSCYGDSGGPLLWWNNTTNDTMRIIQVGIVSFGDGCAKPNATSGNVRISTYIPWIEQQICIMSSNPPSYCKNHTSSTNNETKAANQPTMTTTPAPWKPPMTPAPWKPPITAVAPSQRPSTTPSRALSMTPSRAPSRTPSHAPSMTPSQEPTVQRSKIPTTSPSSLHHTDDHDVEMSSSLTPTTAIITGGMIIKPTNRHPKKKRPKPSQQPQQPPRQQHDPEQQQPQQDHHQQQQPQGHHQQQQQQPQHQQQPQQQQQPHHHKENEQQNQEGNIDVPTTNITKHDNPQSPRIDHRNETDDSNSQQQQGHDHHPQQDHQQDHQQQQDQHDHQQQPDQQQQHEQDHQQQPDQQQQHQQNYQQQHQQHQQQQDQEDQQKQDQQDQQHHQQQQKQQDQQPKQQKGKEQQNDAGKVEVPPNNSTKNEEQTSSRLDHRNETDDNDPLSKKKVPTQTLLSPTNSTTQKSKRKKQEQRRLQRQQKQDMFSSSSIIRNSSNNIRGLIVQTDYNDHHERTMHSNNRMISSSSSRILYDTNIEPRIVGGVEVTDRSRYSFYGFPVGPTNCGMTVFWEDFGITAGHCHGAFIEQGVWVGGNLIDGRTSTMYNVLQEIIHPDYQPTSSGDQNDVLLIRIDGTVPPPYAVLNPDRNIPSDTDNVTVIGYGDQSEIDNGGSFILRTVDLPIVSFAQCNAYWGRIKDDIMICTGTDGGTRDACYGDSGGPLFLAGTNVQVGIVSFGNGCAELGVPSGNVRISAYIPWIQQQVCSLSKNPPSYCTSVNDTTSVSVTVPATATPTYPPPTLSPTYPSITSRTLRPTSIPPMTPAPYTVSPTLSPSTLNPITSPPTTSPPIMSTNQPTTYQPTTYQPTTYQPTSQVPTSIPSSSPTTSAPSKPPMTSMPSSKPSKPSKNATIATDYPRQTTKNVSGAPNLAPPTSTNQSTTTSWSVPTIRDSSKVILQRMIWFDGFLVTILVRCLVI